MLYATVDDVDLLVGALLEPPVPGAMVGPTAMCIITDVFFRIRYGDRFFVDVERQPGSFTKSTSPTKACSAFVVFVHVSATPPYVICTAGFAQTTESGTGENENCHTNGAETVRIAQMSGFDYVPPAILLDPSSIRSTYQYETLKRVNRVSNE